jgi:uncharacterized membrane protein YjgN (DUF898 family)
MDDAPRPALAMTDAISPAGAASPLAALPFSFSGSGAEYFRIWLSNLLLSIYTLGGYSAWAKVRRLQYFYGNTWVGSANFAYHGKPKAIFLGRVVAVSLLGGLHLASDLSAVFFVGLLCAVGLAMPWLLRRALVFRARNSSHRGLRFHFTGRNSAAYRTFLGWTLASVASLGLAGPAAAQRFRHYQFNHLQYGTTAFACTLSVRQCYGVWARVALAWLAWGCALGALAAGVAYKWLNGDALAPALGVAGLVAFWLTRALYVSQMQNLVWNHLALGPHRFQSTLQTWPLFQLMLKNTVLTILSLGLYRPFAVINVLRVRLAALSILPAGSLADFQAQQEADGSAIGAETADLFDLELGL